MEAKLKQKLPQEGTSLPGESLPDSHSGCPSYSGGGTILLNNDVHGRVVSQAPPLENATGQNKASSKDGSNAAQTKLIQQTFHKSMFYNNRTRQSSIDNPPDADRPIMDKAGTMHDSEKTIGNTVNWQRVPLPRQNKRRRTSTTPSPPTEKLTMSNKYGTLNLDVEDIEPLKTTTNKPHYNKPPPVMLYGIEDVTKLSSLIKTGLSSEEFTIKIITRNQLKLNCSTIDAYKRLMTIVRENNLIGHTFTRKDTRPYRIVIRNLHPSTPVEAIREAIEQSGNTVRGEIINARFGPNKTPLSTFFVNIEPHPNNSDVKKILFIYNTRVIIEDPIKKTTVPQCKRCQQYGHTKNNCLRPYRCVKCAEGHNTTDCPKKDRNTPAKCCLCLGHHPANYKGCQVFIEINKRKNNNIQKKPIKTIDHDKTQYAPATPSNKDTQGTEIPYYRQEHQQQGYMRYFPSKTFTKQKSYAEVIKNQQQEYSTPTESKLEMLLTKQADKLDQLINQMAILMNLLTTVIKKLAG